MHINLDLPDELVELAQQQAEREGPPLSAVVERALRATLERPKQTPPFRLRDCSFGGDGLQAGLPASTWERLRELAYDPWPEEFMPEA